MDSSTYVLLGILILLLMASVFFGLYLKERYNNLDKPDDPKWWESPETVPEPKWPGSGQPLPKKEEKKKVDARIGQL